MCDIGVGGKLNCEQFALAMHFVNKKLATGLDPPVELLPEMVPPSLRPKPIVTEEAHASKEFEELQTQVTELQREKLFYEQRASEHDAFTRLKRTELTNLELEMESLFKTLQQREINKSEEQRKLVDFEDKLSKINSQVNDLKQKHEMERSDIEKLKFQIQNMDAAMKTKDNDLPKIKYQLQTSMNEQVSLESKLTTRKLTLNELNANTQTLNAAILKNKCKIDILKQMQANLNVLLKEFDKYPELRAEMKQLEEENTRLNEHLKLAEEGILNSNSNANTSLNQSSSTSFSDAFQSPSQFNTTTPTPMTNPSISLSQVADAFDPFNSSQPQQQMMIQVEDPFQAFDPFNQTNDPFKSVPVVNLNLNLSSSQNGNQGDFNGSSLETDPFASVFDPFSRQKYDAPVAEDDPFASFANNKGPPPRPAPPRPQTPSLKPTKKPTEMSQRPQSAMDFTRNNKLDLFNDFGDPFAPSASTTASKVKDPFAFDWNAFASKASSAQPVASNLTKKRILLIRLLRIRF